MEESRPEGDTVVPLHAWDSQSWQETMMMNFTYRFDDVLDPEKLESALIKLVELKNWRKLGARIRRRADKQLEYHIPQTFTPQRPGIAFSKQRFEVPIGDHSIASSLPKPGDRSRTYPSFQMYQPVVADQNAPIKLKDLLDNDYPQLFVHVTSFENATLISLRWCHTLWDAAGKSHFLRAWTAVLAGREEDVPELTGYDTDPLASLPATKQAMQEYILYDRLLQGFGFILFVLNLLFELIFHPRTELRLLCLTKSHFHTIYNTAQKELLAHNDPTLFLSESDILFAWWAKTLLTASKVHPSRTVNLQNAMSFYHLLPDLFPSDQAYLGNAVSSANTSLPAQEILGSSVCHTALEIRRSLLQQSTPAQARAFIAVVKAGGTGLIRPWNAFLMIVSNWHKMRLFEVDFSPAVIDDGKIEKRANGKGRPSLMGIFDLVSGGPKMRNAGAVLGRDWSGNWWVSWNMRKEVWGKVERMLEGEMHECASDL